MQSNSKQLFVQRFETGGPEEFYAFLIQYVDSKIVDGTIGKSLSPEMELLNYSNQFLQIYKRENKDIYREISFCFRRAAQKTYRMLLKKKLIKRNTKFLNLVE